MNKHEGTPGNLGNDAYYTESFRGGFINRSGNGKNVQDVLDRTFGPVLTARHGEWGEVILASVQRFTKDQLAKSHTMGILLREQKTEEIVGFTYAFPALEAGFVQRKYDEEACDRGMAPEESKRLQEITAEIGPTAILEEHRGQDGFVLMINSLASDLVLGGYEYATTSLRKKYFPKIIEAYDQAIVYGALFDDPDWLGEQIYLRAKLK